ncbi:MAG: hypothetical protein LBM63_00125 [Rikenellaceae bacterium]|nr:hypothetical protein [Rikenellaceae bacterium]
MKKNFFKFLLLGAFTFSLGAGFVGCQDYDGDIKALQKQIDDLKGLDLTKAVKNVTLNGTKLDVSYMDGTSAQLDLSAALAQYDIELKDNTLYVNDVNKGKVDLGAAVADFGVSEDGYLTVGGKKTDVELGANNIQFVKVDGKLQGVKITIDGEEVTIPVTGPLSGLEYVAAVYEKGIPVIDFVTLDLTTDPKKPKTLGSSNKVVFRTNPGNANIDGVDSWAFYNRLVITRATAGEKSDLVSIVDGSIKAVQGGVEMKINGNPAKSLVSTEYADSLNVVVLEAKVGESTVTSGDIKVDFVKYDNVALLNSKAWAASPADKKKVYPNNVGIADAAGLEALLNGITPPALHEVYNLDSLGINPGTFNLNDYVIAATDTQNGYDNTKTVAANGEAITTSTFESLEDLQVTDYTIKFKSLSYKPTDDTDQSSFVTLNAATGVVTVKKPVTGQSAVGRTPAFEAALVNAAGDTLAVHYLKFQIKQTPALPIKLTAVALGDVPYEDLYNTEEEPSNATYPAYKKKGVTWEQINDEVLEVLGIDQATFLAKYTAEPVLTYDAAHTAEEAPLKLKADLGDVVYEAGNGETGTNVLSITIDPQTRFKAHTWTATFTPVANTDPTITVDFTFNLVAPTAPAFDAVHAPLVGSDRVVTVKGWYNTDHYEMTELLSEAFLQSSLDAFITKVVTPIDSEATHEIKLVFAKGDPEFEAASAEEVAIEGATATATGTINETAFDAQVISMLSPIGTEVENEDEEMVAINTRTYDVALISTYANGEVVKTPWKVRFDNPLEVSATPFVLPSPGHYVADSLQQHLTVAVNGVNIYTAGKETGTNATKYGVPAIKNLGWSVLNDEVPAADLYIGVSDSGETPDPATIEPAYGDTGTAATLVWMNHGAALSADRTTENVKLIVKAKSGGTEYAIKTIEIPVTLQKTTAQD